MTFRYLTVEEILAIHKRVVEETGGLVQIRDLGLLFSIAEKPKTAFGGQEMYPDIFLKAAVLLESIVNYHVFGDGNKRTAFLATAVFLKINGLHLQVSQRDGETCMIAVATKKKSLHQIEAWLKKRAK